jgi:hypothetical protein
MKKCCCCIDLTLGVQIIGVLYAVYNIVQIIICSMGISDYSTFRDLFESIVKEWLGGESGLSDYLQLNPILIFLQILTLTDTKFVLFMLLIGHIHSLVLSIWLIIGAQTKNMKCTTYWLCCTIIDFGSKIFFMFFFGIPLLIIPIAFNIYLIICVCSLGKRWEAEMDPEELQRQAEELDNHRNYDRCDRLCEDGFDVICCCVKLMSITTKY